MEKEEQIKIIQIALKKFGDIKSVSKFSSIPYWLLENVLKGNPIRNSQIDKMLWIKERLIKEKLYK